jgi:hypothetical protein
VKRNLLIFQFLVLLAIPGNSQELFFYGVNDRPVDDPGVALTRKELVQKSDRKLVIRTSRKAGEEWVRVTREKIKALGKQEWVVHYRADQLFSRKFYREYTETGPGSFLFKEYTTLNTIRTGQCSRKFPLHLEGIQTEYYPNGKVKSISVFKDNQLVSNQNWLQDGTHYIDSVFYSADREPEFQRGNDFFRSYLLQKISNSGWDLSQIQDQIVIGWVVMETGKIEGVIALEGKSNQLNQYLVNTIAEMPGDWQPALLNGSPVRYFMSIPLNFISREVSFQEISLSEGIMHYDRY